MITDLKLLTLARDIKPLRYAIMRNWDKLPPLGDIDFWVHPDDKKKLEEACEAHLVEKRWYDIRTVGDNYFPFMIENELLEETEEWGEWKVLNKGALFVTLMYHQIVHKGDHRYQDQLDKIFLDQSGIVEPNDKGVGFHDPRKD